MAKQRDKVFPSPDAIVAFLRAQPGKVGTREIAREFGLKNADRAELKRILRELSDEGVIAKRGKKISETAALPATMMADITGRDSDGELIATPTEWDEVESGEPPKIRIHIPRRPQPGTAAGVGDRALLRIEKLDDAEAAVYRGRVIKVVDHAKTRVLGIFRALPGGGGRLIPVDKKQAGRELNIAKADAGGAEDGDLVSVDLVRSRGFGLASGKVKERLGSLASEKAVSLIAIHAHEIPQAFSPAALREAEEAKPATLSGREDWRPSWRLLRATFQAHVLGDLPAARAEVDQVVSSPHKRFWTSVVRGELAMEAGELPNDEALVGGTIRNICYSNARNFLGLDVK